MVSESPLDLRRSAARRAGQRLEQAVAHVLGDELRVEPGSRPDYFADGIDVSSHLLEQRCARRAVVPAQDYEDTVATARRRVGLLVLRRSYEQAPAGAHVRTGAIAPAVDAVLADPSGWPVRLRQWFQELEPAGRALVAASVSTWCTSVLHLVGGHPGIVWADPTLPMRRRIDGRLVQLSASCEATAGTPRRGLRLLSVSDAPSPSSQRVRAAHLALVHALGSGAAAQRVSVASPATGVVRAVEVDDDLLDLAVDRVAEMVAHHLDRERAPAMVGPGCRHCHLLEICPEGAEHLGRVGA